jgi:cytochrome d ubiquinol oxidase subunit I
VPPDERPPATTLLHLAFDTMVGIGFALLGLAAWFGWSMWRRKKLPESKWFWRGAAVAGRGAGSAMESGWIVTEVGRQPWVVQDFMRTEDAVTQAEGIWFAFGGTVILYSALGFISYKALRLIARQDSGMAAVPYGPGPESSVPPAGTTAPGPDSGSDGEEGRR